MVAPGAKYNYDEKVFLFLHLTVQYEFCYAQCIDAFGFIRRCGKTGQYL